MSGSACISYEVVQECLNTALRKAEIPVGADEIRKYLDTVLAPLVQVAPTISLYHRTLDIQARCRFGFYDAAFIIECNLEPTDFTPRVTDAFLQGKAGETLPVLADAVRALY